jgi:predicted ATP-grasp superfamily ATP-dependent carboligase
MAASAARAGFRVYAADLFGDHDLRAVAYEVATIRPYPDGLPDAVAGFPNAPWFYTGAIENYPATIAALAQSRPLAGSSAEAVARVRDPDMLARATREAGLFYPETRRSARGVPTDGSWLSKPLDSAGGRGIRPWYGRDLDAPPSSRVWQQSIQGHRLSCGYVLSATRSRLVATSRQLIGRRWCGARAFAYCGSVDLDPDALDAGLRAQVTRLGEMLAATCALVGLVGADLVVDPHGQVHVIEINPRPTASLELAERSTGVSLAHAHLVACGYERETSGEIRPRSGAWAKGILFARRECTFTRDSLTTVMKIADQWTRADGWPAVADIPEPPCPTPAGVPLCTVFAHSESPRAALTLLRRRVAAIEAAILG